MQKINSYVLAVSLAIIIGVVLEILTPDKKYRHIMRIVSALLILRTLTEPLVDLMNFDFDDIYSVGSSYDEITENCLYYEEKAKSKFDNALCDVAAQSIKNEIISYAANIQCTGEVHVTVLRDDVKIELCGVPHDRKNEITAYIKNNFGVIPEFTEQ